MFRMAQKTVGDLLLGKGGMACTLGLGVPRGVNLGLKVALLREFPGRCCSVRGTKTETKVTLNNSTELLIGQLEMATGRPRTILVW